MSLYTDRRKISTSAKTDEQIVCAYMKV